MLLSLRFTLTLCLGLIFSCVWSQSNTQFKFYLTSYYPEEQNLLLSQTSNATTIYRESTWEIGIPSLAFQWQDKRDRVHQLEVVRLQFNRTEDDVEIVASSLFEPSRGRTQHRLQIAFRYAYQFQLIQLSKNSRLGLGLGLLTGSNWKRIFPHTSSGFPIHLHTMDAAIEATPYYQFPIFERIHLEFSIPLSLYRARWQRLYSDNPILTLDQRESISTTYSFLPKNWSFRVGLAIDL